MLRMPVDEFPPVTVEVAAEASSSLLFAYDSRIEKPCENRFSTFSVKAL